MTKSELSQLFFLKQEIAFNERRLRELETKVPVAGCNDEELSEEGVRVWRK